MATPQKSSRRDFLRGQTAVGELQNLAASLGDSISLPEPNRDGYLLRFSRRAMACEFELLLNAGQYQHGTEAAVAALDLVDELEAQLSVFREDSEVSRLNRSAHLNSVSVEPRLFALFQQAAQIHRDTGGAYDITSGPLTKIWGFYRREGRVPEPADLAATMTRIGMQHIDFDDSTCTVKFRQPDVEINLGSIGKGYALDRLAETLVTAGIESFLLHGGNSSVLARGSQQNACWQIGLRHPLAPDRRIGEFTLRNRALGTSGSGTQFFEYEGRRYGHILDPRTGQPAEGTLSVTVAAPSGAQADALATAFYVMGADESIEYCRSHPGVSAAILSPGDRDDVHLTFYGWPADEIRIYDDSLIIQQIDS
jgi:thiamine biosynthesis lipoprotein